MSLTPEQVLKEIDRHTEQTIAAAGTAGTGTPESLTSVQIKRWITGLAMALCAPSIADELREALAKDAERHAKHLQELEARVNKAIASLTEPKITVQRIDLGSRDPDRFVAGLIGALEETPEYQRLARPTILRRQAIQREQARRQAFGHVEGSLSTFLGPEATGPDRFHQQHDNGAVTSTVYGQSHVTQLEERCRTLATKLEAERKAHERTKAGADSLERYCAKLAADIKEHRNDRPGWHGSAERIAELEAKCARLERSKKVDADTWRDATDRIALLEGANKRFADRVNALDNDRKLLEECNSKLLARANNAENKLERIGRTASPSDAMIERTDRAERGVARLQGHVTEIEAMIKKWDAQIDEVTGAHREGETYADAAVRVIRELTALNLQQSRRITEARTREDLAAEQHNRLRDRLPNKGAGVGLEALITDVIEEAEAPCPDCKLMAAQLDERGEAVRVSDGSGLLIATELQAANDTIAKAQPVLEAVRQLRIRHRMTPPGNHIDNVIAVVEAMEAYERAENDVTF